MIDCGDVRGFQGSGCIDTGTIGKVMLKRKKHAYILHWSSTKECRECPALRPESQNHRLLREGVLRTLCSAIKFDLAMLCYTLVVHCRMIFRKNLDWGDTHASVSRYLPHLYLSRLHLHRPCKCNCSVDSSCTSTKSRCRVASFLATQAEGRLP